MNAPAAAGAAGAAIGAAGLAVYFGAAPTSQVYGRTIFRGRPGRRQLALTYDDGPNPRCTAALLEALERHAARATFFLIGRWAEREPGLVRELRAAGHAIGNHTYSHPKLPLLTSAQVQEELARCRAAIEEAGVELDELGGDALMRPPYGRRRPGTLRAVRAAGYVPVTWSLTAYDWRPSATVDKLARRCARASDGDVILLHDGASSEPAGDREASVAATERTLERFTAEGYSFVSVPELVDAE
jgi:peptidoglycan/xylan/chitin deacetylase (PgdA/CDA1 family)